MSIFCSNLIHPPFGVSLLQRVVNYLFIFSETGSDGIGMFLICVLTVGSICHTKKHSTINVSLLCNWSDKQKKINRHNYHVKSGVSTCSWHQKFVGAKLDNKA